jgi:hypothetical protein
MRSIAKALAGESLPTQMQDELATLKANLGQ